MKLILTSIFVLFTLIAQGQTFMDFNKKELQVDYQKRLDEIALINKNIEELTANLSGLTKKIADLESEKTTKNREMTALQTKIELLPDHFQKLEARDRIELFIKMLPYALPKVNPENYGIGEGGIGDCWD